MCVDPFIYHTRSHNPGGKARYPAPNAVRHFSAGKRSVCHVAAVARAWGTRRSSPISGEMGYKKCLQRGDAQVLIAAGLGRYYDRDLGPGPPAHGMNRSAATH